MPMFSSSRFSILECSLPFQEQLMDQQGNSAGQLPYGGSYPPNHMTTPASGGNDLSKHLFAYQQIQQQEQPQLRQQLQNFWSTQYQEIEKVNDFKNHSLPLARIKKIMKADGDVRMISAEAPVVFARACEMFILELTLRSWNHTEENRRRTLQKNDIAASVSRTDIFDFLVDTVPKEDLKDDILGTIPHETVPVTTPADALPYYYMQAAENPPHETLPIGLVSGGMMMGTPMMDPNAYGQQSQPYMAPAMWPQAPPHMRPQAPPHIRPQAPPHMRPPASDN